MGARWVFLGFYLVCLAITFLYYTRPGGMLYDIERRRAATAPLAGQAA